VAIEATAAGDEGTERGAVELHPTVTKEIVITAAGATILMRLRVISRANWDLDVRACDASMDIKDNAVD